MSATAEQLAELKRCEAGFAWFEKTLNALDDTALRNTIYRENKRLAVTRLRAVHNEVMFLYHVLGIRDEHP